MSDPQATAQPTKVGTPDYLESRKAKCGICGVVYYFDGPHVCPEPPKPAKTYADGLREAAEIARAKARSSRASAGRAEMAMRANVASHRQSDAETADDIAAAIEAKAGSK